jgi:CHAD domain-containing protein/CYTH domain-containing protein
MSQKTPLLELPTAIAVSHVARKNMDEAIAALTRVPDRRDIEALHDFRVAVRRLRSQVRAYRPWLGAAAKRKVRRRLAHFAHATNAARDAEIQLEWLEAARTSLSRGERSGLNWLARRLRSNRRTAYAAARRSVRSGFEEFARSMDDALSDASPDAPPFAEAVASLLRTHADDLGSKVAAIRSAADRRAMHEARISAKRLRYLLEPLRGELRGTKAVVRSFKELQDLLGQIHDTHVIEATLATSLEEVSREKANRLRELALAGKRAELQRERRRDERAGILELVTMARERRDRLFADLEKRWLASRMADLLCSVRSLADTLEPKPDAWTPPVERERKYLLSGLPALAATSPFEEIHQGWIPGDTFRERIRRSKGPGGERFYRTIKLGSGIQRIELEDETTRDVFDAMWPLTLGCRVLKRRYHVRDGEHVWEIDEFLDRELALAEVELKDEADDAELPSWLAPCVVREVTGEPEYLNLSLATLQPRVNRAVRA